MSSVCDSFYSLRGRLVHSLATGDCACGRTGNCHCAAGLEPRADADVSPATGGIRTKDLSGALVCRLPQSRRPAPLRESKAKMNSCNVRLVPAVHPLALASTLTQSRTRSSAGVRHATMPYTLTSRSNLTVSMPTAHAV
ncbi:hypothetical protein SKAU_G00272900 [Synaphobranchus kaupii]|uniref:Uncharacterized protein n=1 Tax=Synaphobranchus kaupii TaxID=118154 RepID=A0A9Q1F0Y3_SYNKA|nr:hypothetical protein SKAU_G00272900 [Synaphobranchus kaupii]